MKRIQSIDLMRGLVMIIMALDHVRDLLHTSSLTQSPTDLATTTPALFFTRWVTHLCAPVFVFLSGTSAFISLHNRQDLPGSRRFLLTRGIWLIVLEFTLVNLGLWFDPHFSVFLYDVIACIGTGFIVLSFLLKWPVRRMALLGLLILFLHGLAPLLPLPESSIIKKVLMPFFAPASFPLGADRLLVIGYPPIPWLAILLLGFAAGRLFLLEQAERRKIFKTLGFSALLLFALLRFVNIYGDPAPWAVQGSRFFSFLSFINVTKYPPSLDFSLLFLGLMFLILFALEGVRAARLRFMEVYGRVPLFYFLVHWYIIHPIVFVMVYLQGFHYSDLVFGFNFGRPKTGSGLPLWAIYLVWLGVVLLMYPLCRWYGRYKALHRGRAWLRYL